MVDLPKQYLYNNFFLIIYLIGSNYFLLGSEIMNKKIKLITNGIEYSINQYYDLKETLDVSDRLLIQNLEYLLKEALKNE